MAHLDPYGLRLVAAFSLFFLLCAAERIFTLRKRGPWAELRSAGIAYCLGEVFVLVVYTVVTFGVPWALKSYGPHYYGPHYWAYVEVVSLLLLFVACLGILGDVLLCAALWQLSIEGSKEWYWLLAAQVSLGSYPVLAAADSMIINDPYTAATPLPLWPYDMALGLGVLFTVIFAGSQVWNRTSGHRRWPHWLLYGLAAQAPWWVELPPNPDDPEDDTRRGIDRT